MTGEPIERRLAAILSADVVGYSRLMAADETGTLTRLEALRRELIDPSIAGHRGRTVKLIGDGMLVEFPSAVEAVRCAIEIQRACSERHADSSSDTKLELRIGINLGDVIVRGDNLYGDGVNVAARLESVAEPGGICISRAVRDQVRDKLVVRLDDLGEIEVKNIARPVRVFRVRTGEQPAESRPSAIKVPASEGPSIVVLPFANMSGDPEQEYFSDGITEDLITDLSKIPGLLVIARNSSFAFKGKAVDIVEICKQFRVRYALEGSVRKAGQRVRITAQLIDGATGGHLWAERYDRELTDIFAVQDEVTRQIVTALKINFDKARSAQATPAAPARIEAHDCFLRGRELMQTTNLSREGVRSAGEWFRRAVELDPTYPGGYGGLAQVYALQYQNQWGSNPADDLRQARRYVDEGLAQDPRDAYLHFQNALVSMFEKNYERWQSEVELALALNPNLALALNVRGTYTCTKASRSRACPLSNRRCGSTRPSGSITCTSSPWPISSPVSWRRRSRCFASASRSIPAPICRASIWRPRSPIWAGLTKHVRSGASSERSIRPMPRRRICAVLPYELWTSSACSTACARPACRRIRTFATQMNPPFLVCHSRASGNPSNRRHRDRNSGFRIASLAAERLRCPGSASVRNDDRCVLS